MGVRPRKYASELEKELKQGKGLEQSHSKATRRSQPLGKKRTTPHSKLVKKVARKLREIFYGSTTYKNSAKGPTFNRSGYNKQLKKGK